MRVYPILLILVVAASTVSRSPADEPDDVPSTSISATSDDAADAGRVRLLFLSQERPIRIDVLVKIGEQSIETRWRKGAEALFARLDKDGNKQLDTVEYRRAPWVSSTETKRGNDVFSLFLRGVADRLQDRRKKTEKALDLSAFVKQMRTHRPPFVVEASPKVSPGKELFQWLDENGDNRLDAMELDRMEAVVARLDRNRDRALQAAELDQFKNPFSLQQQSMIMTSERQSNMVHVVDAATDRLAVQILDRYADNKDSIDAAWFGVDAVGHDEDGDKRLDVNELVNWISVWPAEITMHVDPASNDPAKSSIRIDHDSVDDIICRTDGHVRASFSGRGAYFDTRWSLWRDNPYTQFLEANFQYADTDNNAYLDRKEASSSIYNNIFSELDADGNGMVFEDEVEQYSKLLNSGTLGVTLTVTEKGQSLFSMLDQDANQVISLVEAAKCRELLARFDSNQDGAIAVDELLPTYQLSADYTAPKGLQVYFPGVRVQSADVRSKVDAPPWFSRLDINGDEAISRFEFPWSLERFASLDANGDGSIFIEESRP